MCEHNTTIRLSIRSPPSDNEDGESRIEYRDPLSSIFNPRLSTPVSSIKRLHGIPAGIEGYRFVFIRISDHPVWILSRLHRVDGIANHPAQHDDSLVGRRPMFPGSVRDDPLVLLCDAVLFMRVKIPPAVLNSFVDAGLAFFESLRFERHGLSRLPVSMRIEIDPISRRLEIIGGHAKANHLPWVFAHAGGRM